MEDPQEGKDKNPHHHPGHPDVQNIYPTPTAGIGRDFTHEPEPAKDSKDSAAASDDRASNPITADQSHNTHEGLHILQWFTFMFWGLTVLALAFLTGSVFERLIAGTDTYNFNYYVISSLVILLPLAFVCDVIYARREPAKKVGLASRIMAAYSVIFALFGIFALLAIAWNIVGWATAGGADHSSSIADIISGLFIFFYYLASFMRTLNPAHFSWITTAYRFTVLGFVIVFVVLGFTKPTFYKSPPPAVSTGSNSPAVCNTDLVSGGSCTQSNSETSTSESTYNHGKLEPSVVGGTQCDIPTLSDGSTTGQVALAGGATCDEAEADIQAATGHNGWGYKAPGGYTCTSIKQGADTQWSSYWNNDFYSYNCTAGSKQVAFNLQTRTQSQSG